MDLARVWSTSKASKLKNIVFRCQYLSGEWVAITLEIITPQYRDLQQITAYPDIRGHAVREDGDIVEQTVDANPDVQ